MDLAAKDRSVGPEDRAAPGFAFDNWSSCSDLPRSGERGPVHPDLPAPGTTMGGVYSITGVLGSGAMGVVLLARDKALDRDVAIKFVHSNLLTPALRKRFSDEARAMARVRHPNVIQVYAFGEHHDSPYIVMEFVEGCTLEKWLADRSSPPELDVALHILEGVCQGAAAIHACNTVHRDIKPGNILLDQQMRPRLADLGLAVLHGQDEPTRQELVGTPAYMAPEAAFSDRRDPDLRVRADVYSVACVAYELLTGNPPFVGSGAIEVLIQHATEPITPPSLRRSGLPVEIDHVILRALAKDPRKRTPSIDALRSDLITACRGSLDPERILVADDDEDTREAMQLTLSTAFLGAEIECVADGLAALEAFERKPPSVAILDLRMPGLDGIELTTRLRERPCAATTPIIVLTASGGPGEWRQLAALGADRFLVKPVVADDVVALIRRVLAERSRPRLQVVA